MNAIERRALYHLLRMNWLSEPTLIVESWQVEDYRSLSLGDLFNRLKLFKIQLDRTSFIAHADECDSPEELTDHLTGNWPLSTAQEDQIYLLIFELWRRLMSEKPSLSIMCNELDYQIFLYDHQKIDNPLELQDALTHFIQILDENVDQGMESHQVFKLISAHCANDIESFLYDFIAEQIEEGSESYAIELLDDFDPYLGDNKWFKLLRLRLCEKTQSHTAQKISERIIEEALEELDLDYNLEFLSVMAEMGDPLLFRRILKQTLPLLKSEQDFQDLLAIAIDYLHRLDQEQQEMALRAILDKRLREPLEMAIQANDPDLAILINIFNSKNSQM